MPHYSLPAAPIELPADTAIVVGFSGGLDSTVLLHALAADAHFRARGLRAVHVDHGLHADSAHWAAACEAVCRELQVPFRALQVDVAVASGHGPEAAARHARHAALASVLAPGEVVALAHHRDDQAETFLLRALRASGPDGLAAMRPWRRFGHAWLWRPLLDAPRAQLLAYAQQHALRWIDDPSNTDTAFDRNFLRQRVLPLLRERWPQAEAAFAQSATLCAEASALLETGDAQALAAVATADPHCLSRVAVAALPAPRRARVLRRWIAALGLPALPANGITRIESEVLPARADADAAFAWHGAAVRSWRELLHADVSRPPLPSDWRAVWNAAAPLPLPGGGELHLEGARFDDVLVVHARQGGERITLPGRAHSHALKHVLQDLGVPPWQRERLPLLSDASGTLLAAGDLVHSAAFDAWLRARGARLCWND
ncbi:tRNA lysidine(34) synthetase TilS [Lysobacter cavernae]|uniref:tRNA(Ile)-lysidine synthase n=1 Tax=Lysobacter cavernae TaxID=1685901 RepID=A0ABV7RK86_9GAMM